MKITVSFIGVLATYVGAENAVLEVGDGGSAHDLLSAIGNRFGNTMDAKVWSSDRCNFTGPVMFLVNGSLKASPQVHLKDKDKVKLIIGLAGG